MIGDSSSSEAFAGVADATIYSAGFLTRQMTPPSNPPVKDQDCMELEKLADCVSDGNTVAGPVTGIASRKMMGKLISGVRRLSTISEREPDKMDTDLGLSNSLGRSEWGGSSLCSNKLNSSSDDSYQPDPGDDCAALLLACLHCRFHELMVLLPETCERAVSHCFPSYTHIMESSERDEQGRDCCNYELELDCKFCSSCQDAGELIELAMEMSEVCYR